MLLTMGCAAQPKPVAHEPVKFAPLSLPPIHDPPMPTFIVPPRSFVPQERAPMPCGHSTTVKVSKLNINMPKGGKLEIEGIKTSTDSYSIVLEGVEFITEQECK